MQVHKTRLKDVLLIEPKVFRDDRGFFLETYSQKRYQDAGIPQPFVQDNRAFSSHGVLRGLHFQIQNPQGKLVSASIGEVFDVAVDLRQESPTYGMWEGFHISAENCKQVYIPPGFAHGYLVLSKTAEFLYKCTDYYAAGDEGGILWNDPDLAIEWPVSEPILSQKDLVLPRLKDLPKYF